MHQYLSSDALPCSVCSLNLFGETETFVETIYTTAGINQFLLAGEVRMAFTANIDLDNVYVFGRSRLECFSASTLDGDNFIIRMDIRFHINSPLNS